MTDITTPNTETVEGIVTLLRGRLARGEPPMGFGDSFPMFQLQQAMNILHDESLDHDALAIHVITLRGILAGVLDGAGLGSIPWPYLDAAYRVIERDERIAEETGVPAPQFSVRG